MRRLVSATVVLAVVASAAAIGWWAGQEVLRPPADPVGEPEDPISYVVPFGSVGRSFTFAAVASWELVAVGRNGAEGVVTSLRFESGSVASAGDVLYSVDLRPVVVAEGGIPSFRRLSLGVEGIDVAQLQAFLTDQGFYTGELDGVFGRSTRTAVNSWQESLGVEETGIVERGDLVFVAELPARLALADDVSLGELLPRGARTVLLVPDDPYFRIPLSVDQGSLVPLTAQVFITYPGGTWEATIEQAVESPLSGDLELILAGAGGGPVCGVVCPEWVDLFDPTHFQAEIVVIPETTGPVVPVAAISVDPANQAHVILSDGSLILVTIVEAANGLAVIEGIEVGTEILIPSPGG